MRSLLMRRLRMRDPSHSPRETPREDSSNLSGNQYEVQTLSGILKGWVKSVWGEECENPEFNIVDRLNNAWLADDMNILCRLGDYDSYRGWGGYQYGSPVWSDIRSWTRVTQEDTYGYNIVGHTLLERPLVLEQITDLDCRKACYMDDQGLLRSYDTDEEYVKADCDD